MRVPLDSAYTSHNRTQGLHDVDHILRDSGEVVARGTDAVTDQTVAAASRPPERDAADSAEGVIESDW